MKNDNDLLTDHDYDGIREYDNPLPAWWLAVFFMTIIFGFLYWLHYSVSGAGQTQLQELKEDMAIIEKSQKIFGGDLETEIDLHALAASVEVKHKGEMIYGAKCAVCHGPQLQGLIGPNLTDDYWLHGKGTMIDMIATIRKGVLEKGMPSWEGQMPKADVQAVVAYVSSQRGRHPPNPKAPQGDKVAN